MTVRAKFRLNFVKHYNQVVTRLKEDEEGNPRHVDETVEACDLNFMAVYNGSPENKKFWEATPAGSLTLSTVNRAAWEQFEEGKEYYLDITPAE